MQDSYDYYGDFSHSQQSSEDKKIEANHEERNELLDKNLVTPQDSPNKREIDFLYQNICQKKLTPKEWLKNVKSDKTLKVYQLHDNQSKKDEPKKDKWNGSLQNQIILSNYRQLLRNNFRQQSYKDRQIEAISKKFQQILQENDALKQENYMLKKQFGKLRQKDLSKKQKLDSLTLQVNTLSRQYDNLCKETQANQKKLKLQIRQLSNKNMKSQAVIDAIKDSIRILRGKKIHNLQQMWKQWQQIFELASLQQCKLTKAKKKY